MDRFDLENKIMNASFISNDLKTLAEEIDEDEEVPAKVADKYSIALLGLANLCDARFNAIDRVFETLIPELDALNQKDHQRILEVQKMFQKLDDEDKKVKTSKTPAPAVFYQDNDSALWSKGSTDELSNE